jgi:hypothetical protein
MSLRNSRRNLQEDLQVFTEAGGFVGVGTEAVLQGIVRVGKIRFLGKGGAEDKG